MGVAPAEDVAWDNEQVVADSLCYELRCGPPRGSRKRVEGTLRAGELELVAKGVYNQLPLAAVCLDLLSQVLSPRDSPRMLNDARGTHETELLEFRHFLDEHRRPVCETEPPACHAMGLAETVDDEGIGIPSRW